MKNNRKKSAVLNISVSLISQIATIICGLIAPRLLLAHFGSETYGATTSIAQFLSYIALMEGGIGGVARAALYKPLAEKDMNTISNILFAIKRFFNKVGLIFIVYVLIIAFSFKYISSINSLDYLSTCLLVVIISLSTFAQYFIGISYSLLIQADQKTYIVTGVSTLTVIFNTICVVVLVNLNFNILVVKLVSSIIFVLRPIYMAIYCRKHYKLAKRPTEKHILKDTKEGLAQHIAYFVHLNTDVVILTLLSSLKNVAVYSVYYLIISNVQSLATSFSAGMEAIFGEMYAKKEKNLKDTFLKYEDLMSIVGIILFVSTAILIVPFVKLYTKDITDANYVQPLFALIMIFASLIYLMRLPYHNMVIAAGHFRETKIAAYGEAFLNVVISLALVWKFGIVGVAVGTAVATTFRYFYYAVYLSKTILEISIKSFVKRNIVNFTLVGVLLILASKIMDKITIGNYFDWAVVGVLVFVATTIITLSVYACFYKGSIKQMFRMLPYKRKV